MSALLSAYKIEALEQEIWAKLEESGGDVSVLEGYLMDYLDSSGEILAAKVDNFVHVIRRLEGEAAIRQKAADEHAKAAKEISDTALAVKERLKQFLIATKRDEIVTTSKIKVGLKNAGGLVTLKLHVKPEELPIQFFQQIIKTEFKAKTDAIREALAAGDESLLGKAELLERGKILTIK